MASEEHPGRWLSPTEQRVWDVLAVAGDDGLFGKQIARRLGVVYGAELKNLLQNLVERGVLTHRRGVGYRRASTDPNQGGYSAKG